MTKLIESRSGAAWDCFATGIVVLPTALQYPIVANEPPQIGSSSLQLLDASFADCPHLAL